MMDWIWSAVGSKGVFFSPPPMRAPGKRASTNCLEDERSGAVDWDSSVASPAFPKPSAVAWLCGFFSKAVLKVNAWIPIPRMRPAPKDPKTTKPCFWRNEFIIDKEYDQLN